MASGMRLLAVPLARASPNALAVSTFVSAPLPPSSTSSTAAKKSATTAEDSQGRRNQLPLTTRLLNRASNYWLSLNEPGVKSTFDWKKRTYRAGESLMDRIEYEEWALKGVDPQNGPVLTELRNRTGEKVAASQAAGAVELLYPSAYLQGPVLIAELRKLTSHRTPHHRARLIWCLIGMPITIPFALVPIIPNLPFFYLIWRAYSHWRAYQSSSYLAQLLELNIVKAVPSPEMNRIFGSAQLADSTGRKSNSASRPYASGQTASGANSRVQSATATSTSQAKMVMQAWHVDKLASRFSLSAQTVVDLNRARLQTQASIEKGELKKLLEAAEVDKSTTPDALDANPARQSERSGSSR